LKSELASRYRLKHLPTMMILGPDGKELDRREGIIGQLELGEVLKGGKS